MKKEDKPFVQTYLLTGIVCLCFLIGGLLFVYFMTRQSAKESVSYLQNTAVQSRTALYKQIIGDFQTLDGVAICLEDGEWDKAQIARIIKEINDNNTFTRMGLADLQGRIDWLDVNGETYAGQNLSRAVYFQKALQGESAISDTLFDAVSSQYVNFYGMPMTDAAGRVIGVLCAMNSADLFRKILDVPVYGGQGYSNLIDKEGRYVVRSSLPVGTAKDALSVDMLGQFEDEELAQLKTALSQGGGGVYSYKDAQNGGKQLIAIEPVGVNDWFVMSVVPLAVLQQHYNATAVGTTLLIAAACLIFLALLYRLSHLYRRSRKTLMHLAYDDELIGCRNFNKFLLDAANRTAPSGDCRTAVWYCDLKRFKYFNDMFGYQTGDDILRCLASAIETVGEEDFLFCRVAADHFAGLLPYRDKRELTDWFRRLEAELRTIGGRDGLPAVNICVGFYCPGDGDALLDMNAMVNRAHMAQQSVKNGSGSGCAVFSKELRDQIRRDSELEARSRAALEQGEFVVYMQPKVDIQQGDAIGGAEALVRWAPPDQPLISPGEFIPLFERNGFIVELDRYMLEQVCRWLRGYLDRGGRELVVSVNVSRLGLFQEDFVEHYIQIKETYRIPDGLLDLEFTESVVLDDNALFIRSVRRLQQHGFLCSLDDFGTGYSSLNLLKSLPIDVLKLDILFFTRDADHCRERIVIANILHMARQLHIRTIAEGVEALEQVAFLRDAGCDMVQGFVFARPMPLDEFDRLLEISA